MGNKPRAKGAGGVPCFFNIKKLNAKDKGPKAIFNAAQHNLRTCPAEFMKRGNIDPDRIGANETLMGRECPLEVEAQANQQMEAHGIKPRKNAVRVLEALFSLPSDHGLDVRNVFMACAEWAGQRFGGRQNILSATVHLDEAEPHCHVLILPIQDGKLNGSEMVGNAKSVGEHRASFYKELGKSYGLKRPIGKAITGDAAYVIQHMEEQSDPATQSATWDATKSAIRRDPVPFMGTLGLAPLSKPGRTCTQIMTSTGSKTSEDKKSYRETVGASVAEPYRETGGAFAAEPYRGTNRCGEKSYMGTEKELSLSCVGKGFQSPQFSPLSEPVQGGAEDQPATTQGQGPAVLTVDADGVICFGADPAGVDPVEGAESGGGDPCPAVVTPDLQQQAEPIGQAPAPEPAMPRQCSGNATASGAGEGVEPGEANEPWHSGGQDFERMVFARGEQAAKFRREAGQVRRLLMLMPSKSGVAGWRLIAGGPDVAQIEADMIAAASMEFKSKLAADGPAAAMQLDDCLRPSEVEPGCWRYALLRDVALGPALGLSREQRQRVVKAWKKAGAWGRV